MLLAVGVNRVTGIDTEIDENDGTGREEKRIVSDVDCPNVLFALA